MRPSNLPATLWPPTRAKNLLSLLLLLMSSHQEGRGVLTLDGPLEQCALRAQGLDLHLLWVVWILVKVSPPPLRRRLLALQESPGWTVRPRDRKSVV